MTAQAKEPAAERIDSRIYADRFMAMVKRIQPAEERLAELMSLAGRLPPAIHDGEAVEALEKAVIDALNACAALGSVRAELEDMAGLDQISAALWRAIGACRLVANVMGKPFARADELRTGAAAKATPSDLSLDAWLIRDSLLRISAAWVHDAGWIRRLHAQAETRSIKNDAVPRIKRMRARRKAGLAAIATTIEVDDGELRKLQLVGLLPKEGATQDDIRDALQAWFMASLAAISPHDDNPPMVTHAEKREGTTGISALGHFLDVIRRRYGPPA